MRSSQMRSQPSPIGVASVPGLAFESSGGHLSPLSPRRSLPYISTNETSRNSFIASPSRSPATRRRRISPREEVPSIPILKTRSPRKAAIDMSAVAAKEKARSARKLNDAMVYLDGPQIYTCGHCRTHLTTHDEIISKSFQGRHGRAYLFDNCVNVVLGPPEDRRLMTGLHSVCDIFCKRCKSLVGWTYEKAYEPSQKYKEGKFIIEKINLHLETSDYFDVAPPAGERNDRFRARSISWGSESSHACGQDSIYEYPIGAKISSRQS